MQGPGEAFKVLRRHLCPLDLIQGLYVDPGLQIEIGGHILWAGPASQAHGVGLDPVEHGRGQRRGRLQPGSLKMLPQDSGSSPQLRPDLDIGRAGAGLLQRMVVDHHRRPAVLRQGIVAGPGLSVHQRDPLGAVQLLGSQPLDRLPQVAQQRFVLGPTHDAAVGNLRVDRAPGLRELEERQRGGQGIRVRIGVGQDQHRPGPAQGLNELFGPGRTHLPSPGPGAPPVLHPLAGPLPPALRRRPRNG